MPIPLERHAVLLQAGRRVDIDYVDDIVDDTYRVVQGAPEKASEEDFFPLHTYAVYNIARGTSENLLDFISTLKEELVRAGV